MSGAKCFDVLKQHCAIVAEMRYLIGQLVPEDFTWSLQIDRAMHCEITFWSKKAPRRGRVGRVSDSDYSVCVYLLQSVSWYDERRLSGVESSRPAEGPTLAPLGVRPDSSAAVGFVSSVEAKHIPRRAGQWF